MEKTRIKICGVRDLATYELCAELQVDYIGINFSPKSPRGISLFTWLDLQKRLSSVAPRLVFLFFQNSQEEISSIVQASTPDYVQFLVGSPDENFILQEKSSGASFELLPAVAIRQSVEDHDLPYPKAEFLVLDSHAGDKGGGSGKSFPWQMAKSIHRPYLLAGGLNASNVSQAISILRPFGVDVASGVESDGKKDPDKIRDFVKNARG